MRILRKLRPTYANVAATLALVIAIGGGAIAVASGPDVSACVKKSTTAQPGAIRIVSQGTACLASEDPLSWPGSADTPQDVLDKVVQVDGQGSGLDSSFLDGIDSTGFLRNNGKAVDADLLDGINSSAFVRRGTASGGTIGLSSIAANTCKDVVFGIGSLKVGDIMVLNVAPGDSLPARLQMQPLDVPADGTLNVRICNGTNTASVADSDIKLRWYALRP